MCDIFKYEFIFNKPCQKLDELLDETFERLKLQNIIRVPSTAITFEQTMARRFAEDFDTDSDSCDAVQANPDDEANVTLPSESYEKRLVLMTAIAPFAHTYLAVAKTLYLLIDNSMLERDFLMACVDEITTNVERFECKYGERCSLQMIADQVFRL